MWDYHGFACLAGLPHYHPRKFLKKVVEQRFQRILPFLERKPDEHCYDGSRCTADGVASRFWEIGLGHQLWEQSVWSKIIAMWNCVMVWAGKRDDVIEQVWHERAAAEFYYRYEKDWGE